MSVDNNSTYHQNDINNEYQDQDLNSTH